MQLDGVPDSRLQALAELIKNLGAEEVKELDLDDFLGSDDEGGGGGNGILFIFIGERGIWGR